MEMVQAGYIAHTVLALPLLVNISIQPHVQAAKE